VDAVLSVDDVMQMGHDDFNQDEDDKDNNIGDNHGLGSSFQGFGEPRQAFVFSATLTLPDEDRKLVSKSRLCGLFCLTKLSSNEKTIHREHRILTAAAAPMLFTLASLNKLTRACLLPLRWCSIESN
jgi:hypothetical protein